MGEKCRYLNISPCISLIIIKFEHLFMFIIHSSYYTFLFLKLSSYAICSFFSWIYLPLFYWCVWFVYTLRHSIFAGYVQLQNLLKGYGFYFNFVNGVSNSMVIKCNKNHLYGLVFLCAVSEIVSYIIRRIHIFI